MHGNELKIKYKTLEKLMENTCETFNSMNGLNYLINYFQCFYNKKETISLHSKIKSDDYDILLDMIDTNIITNHFLIARLYDCDRFFNNNFKSCQKAFEEYLLAYEEETNFYLKSMCLFAAFYLYEKYGRKFNSDLLLLCLLDISNNMSYEITACNSSVISIFANYMSSHANVKLFNSIFNNIINHKSFNDFILEKIFDYKRLFYKNLGCDTKGVDIEEMHFLENRCKTSRNNNESYALMAFNIAKRLKDQINITKYKKMYEEQRKKSFDDRKNNGINITLDVSKLNEVLNRLVSRMTKREILYYLGHEFLCNFDNEKNMLLKDKDISVFSSLFPTTYVGENGEIISKENKLLEKDFEENSDKLKENLYQKKIENYMQYLTLSLPFLDDVFSWDESDLVEEVDRIVNSSYIISSDRKSIVKRGLLAGFKMDFELSICLLIPQIEEAIRVLANLCESSTSQYDENGIIKQNTIESMITREEFIDKIDPNVIYTINAVLNNSYGINYRNNHAHGLIKIYNTHLSQYVFLITLSLIMIYSRYGKEIDFKNYNELIKSTFDEAKEIDGLVS